MQVDLDFSVFDSELSTAQGVDEHLTGLELALFEEWYRTVALAGSVVKDGDGLIGVVGSAEGVDVVVLPHLPLLPGLQDR